MSMKLLTLQRHWPWFGPIANWNIRGTYHIIIATGSKDLWVCTAAQGRNLAEDERTILMNGGGDLGGVQRLSSSFSEKAYHRPSSMHRAAPLFLYEGY